MNAPPARTATATQRPLTTGDGSDSAFRLNPESAATAANRNIEDHAQVEVEKKGSLVT